MHRAGAESLSTWLASSTRPTRLGAADRAEADREEAGSKSRRQHIDRRIILDATGHPNNPKLFHPASTRRNPLSTGSITQAPGRCGSFPAAIARCSLR